jgi:hypothetical protein
MCGTEKFFWAFTVVTFIRKLTNVTERSEVTQVSPTTEQTGRCY